MTVDSTIDSTEDSNTLNDKHKKIAAKAEKRRRGGERSF
jgi:hypothetical protein